MDYHPRKMSLCLALVLLHVLKMGHAGTIAYRANYKCSYYKFFGDNKSWEDSTTACNSEKGTLVVMETLDEWEFINSVLQSISYPTEWYIGLKSKTRTRNKNSFSWINGKSLTFDKWFPGEPSGNGLYVKIIKYYHGQGTFADVDGRRGMPYICEHHKDSKQCSEPSESTPSRKVTTTSTTTITTATTTKKATVPSTTRGKGLVHTTNYKCSDYKFFDDTKSWEDSNIACKRENGTLVVMETLDEWQFINSVIQYISNPKEWYIGLKSKTSTTNKNSFTWINGKSLTIDKWFKGEPSASGMYVKIIKEYRGLQGTFDDSDGRRRMPYICEYHKDSMQCTGPSETTPPPKARATTTTTTAVTTTTTKKVTIPSTTPGKD